MKILNSVSKLQKLREMGFNAEHKRRVIPNLENSKETIHDVIVIYPIKTKRNNEIFYNNPKDPKLEMLIQYCNKQNLSLTVQGEPFQINLHNVDKEED